MREARSLEVVLSGMAVSIRQAMVQRAYPLAALQLPGLLLTHSRIVAMHSQARLHTARQLLEATLHCTE